MITVTNVSKTFMVHKREPGLTKSLKALFKRTYTPIDAVKNINFSIEQGEIVGFIGPNGAGKTTTLKMLSGLLFPTNGTLSVAGYTPYERDHDFLKKISLVMGQKNQLFWDLPAVDTFTLQKQLYGISDDQYEANLDVLVDMLDARDFIQQQVRKLSLGQRMKCELIAALIYNPSIVFLDEPTIGLDVVTQKKLRSFIKNYNKQYNATIILTSHYMADVQELCERVIVINNGSLGYDGSLADLVHTYASHKTITLVFDTEVEEQQLYKYGTILSYSPLKTVFSVPRMGMKKTASLMLSQLPVEDIDIAEIPIEEVIRQVFSENNDT
ncbi:ABC transporter [candidate division WWE3 bacterium CG_4_10_14_0_2_um_filter_41_14]|uniref:ABC transporter n=1 Tax=candidate division WWE3 bacterium CG_4_10_14_0_2_um_filter_41_14 TaxID=1975072 RepID=A0A2M7TK89_UNCKA|nr:MAG: ABC transporter [candidate division WWE3 bacterium CG_4_10_14_0_2_um_filter_41_14]